MVKDMIIQKVCAHAESEDASKTIHYFPQMPYLVSALAPLVGGSQMRNKGALRVRRNVRSIM